MKLTAEMQSKIDALVAEVATMIVAQTTTELDGFDLFSDLVVEDSELEAASRLASATIKARKSIGNYLLDIVEPEEFEHPDDAVAMA